MRNCYLWKFHFFRYLHTYLHLALLDCIGTLSARNWLPMYIVLIDYQPQKNNKQNRLYPLPSLFLCKSLSGLWTSFDWAAVPFFQMFVYSTVIQISINTTSFLKNSDIRPTNHETKQENVKKIFQINLMSWWNMS